MNNVLQCIVFNQSALLINSPVYTTVLTVGFFLAKLVIISKYYFQLDLIAVANPMYSCIAIL